MKNMRNLYKHHKTPHMLKGDYRVRRSSSRDAGSYIPHDRPITFGNWSNPQSGSLCYWLFRTIVHIQDRVVSGVNN